MRPRWAPGSTARPDARWAEWLHHHQLAPFAVYRLRQTGVLVGLPAGFGEALRDLYDNAAGPPVPDAAQIVNEGMVPYSVIPARDICGFGKPTAVKKSVAPKSSRLICARCMALVPR